MRVASRFLTSGTVSTVSPICLDSTRNGISGITPFTVPSKIFDSGADLQKVVGVPGRLHLGGIAATPKCARRHLGDYAAMREPDDGGFSGGIPGGTMLAA